LLDEKNEAAIAQNFYAIIGGADEGLENLLMLSIKAYYDCLLGELDESLTSHVKLHASWNGIRTSFRSCLSDLKAVTVGESVGRLMRRWREADHPAENLKLAILAKDATDHNSIAVGIGWGGIELPLTFQYWQNKVDGEPVKPVVLASWSHYRGPEKRVHARSFPSGSDITKLIAGKSGLLMDDNVLTGITLEAIRDYLRLNGASSAQCFVTRYSGERRLSHMKREGHGVADPNYLLNDVGGYLGETPFARSWSTKSYKNPIGVFSLTKRRILECIHNNSTVELYDREGF